MKKVRIIVAPVIGSLLVTTCGSYDYSKIPYEPFLTRQEAVDYYSNQMSYDSIVKRSAVKSGKQDVTLVEIRPEVVSAIQERGLSVTRGDETEVLDVPITSRIEDVPDPDLIMFTVKSDRKSVV